VIRQLGFGILFQENACRYLKVTRMKFLAVHLTTRETSLSQEAKTIPAVFGDERM